MKKSAPGIFLPYLLLSFLAMFIFFSCAATPPVTETGHKAAGIGVIPERPVRPQVPVLIMGTGIILPQNLAAFLFNNNPVTDLDYIQKLAAIYTEEAAAEGVNYDVAFAQMMLETGFLRYGGDVKPEQYNFCGLGAIGNGDPGNSFPDPRTGIRAHIQHLKAYATDEPLNQDLVDPRYRWVRYGSSPAITGLAGTWAADRNYAEKIKSILERLYDFSFQI